MLRLRGASKSEHKRDFRSLKNINYEFSLTHATTPWGFSPLTKVTYFKHEYLSNREELRGVPYINENISTTRNHKKCIVWFLKAYGWSYACIWHDYLIWYQPGRGTY